MTSISRRETDPSTHSVLADSPEDAKASSGVKGGQPAVAGAGRTASSSNHLEAYSGPSRSPKQAPANAPPSSSEGSLTAGQLALMGPAKRPDTPKLETVYQQIQASLTWGLDNLVVNKDDVRTVHDRLDALTPADYRKVMDRMDGAGLLEKYLDAASPEARQAFLAQAERKGYVETRPAEKALPAPGSPPDGAVFFVPKLGLPDPVREVIFGANITAANNYHAAYDAYLERYRQEAMRAGSLDELRNLGEPKDALGVSHQLTSADPDYKRVQAQWARAQRPPRTEALTRKAIEDRRRDLTGEARAGTFRLKHEREVSVDIRGTSLKAAKEDGISQYGKQETTWKVGVESSSNGHKAGLEIDSTGEKKATVGVDTPFFAVELDSEGGARLEMRAGSVAKVYSEFNPEKGTFGGGVSVDKELAEQVEVKAEVGFEWQGARRGRAGEALKGSGLFEPQPEDEQKRTPAVSR